MFTWLTNLFDRATIRLGAARSPQWREVRNKFIKEHPLCAVCGTKKKLEAHHVRPYHEFPALELDESNLIVLCREHHFLFGHFLSWFSHNPDVVSDSKIWYDKIKGRS